MGSLKAHHGGYNSSGAVGGQVQVKAALLGGVRRVGGP
jgi:hypothetical protein